MTGIERAVALAGSQQGLAEMLGVTQQAVAKMVARGYAALDRAEQISNATGVPKSELLDPRIAAVLK